MTTTDLAAFHLPFVALVHLLVFIYVLQIFMWILRLLLIPCQSTMNSYVFIVTNKYLHFIS